VAESAALLMDVMDAMTCPSLSEKKMLAGSEQQLPETRFLSRQYRPFWHCNIALLPEAVLWYVQIVDSSNPWCSNVVSD